MFVLYQHYEFLNFSKHTVVLYDVKLGEAG